MKERVSQSKKYMAKHHSGQGSSGFLSWLWLTSCETVAVQKKGERVSDGHEDDDYDKKSGDEEDKKIDDNSKSFFWGKR